MTRVYRLLSSSVTADPPQAAEIELSPLAMVVVLVFLFILFVIVIGVTFCVPPMDRVSQVQQLANRGIKRKIIEVIPKFTYSSKNEDRGHGNSGMLCSSECVICLGEYVDGDEIRVLPQCGHGFHVGCIDTWLISHSSCPWCRQILVSSKCKTWGKVPIVSPAEVPLEAEDNEKQHCSCSTSSDYFA
ncbi:zinc finger, RING/FYVE/PHD-type containing protein [Tanacetum coccineum]